MKLAKEHLDIGIFTNRGEDQIAFWQQQVGLPFEEALPVGGGVLQHRHGLNGSVFKLNVARDPLPDTARAGYRELLVARDGIERPQTLVDPEGNRVTLVAPGHGGIAGIGVVIGVRSLDEASRYYGEALGWEHIARGRFRCGDTLVLLEEDQEQPPVDELRGSGYRYMTVQVWDVDEEHAVALSRGAREGQAPRTLGTTARISFLRDPDGNWLEVSQRASLTGPLTRGE